MHIKKNNKIISKLFDVVLRSWWVFLFLLICMVGYDVGIKKRKMAIFEMKCKLDNLMKEQVLAISKKEDLNLRISSQSDPSWIEMVLMTELGVVPDNQIKVHFKN